MILVWGVSTDPSTTDVVDALRRRGSSVTFLDQLCYWSAPAAVFSRADQDGGLAMIGTDRTQIELTSVRSALLRPYASASVAAAVGHDPDADSGRELARIEAALWSWAARTPALVVNPPRAATSNDCKPLQLEAIEQAGFRVPETLLTNDPDAVEQFWRRHGAVVYKSISGRRSIVTRLHAEQFRRSADLGTCPVQFQAYVPGTDFRVHTVGRQLAVAVEIRSAADDYRFGPQHGLPTTMRPSVLPLAVRERCLALSAAEGLVVGGIDLRRTPDGHWYCFEINPMPAFAIFDQDGAIAAAVAELLIGAPR